MAFVLDSVFWDLCVWQTALEEADSVSGLRSREQVFLLSSKYNVSLQDKSQLGLHPF